MVIFKFLWGMYFDILAKASIFAKPFWQNLKDDLQMLILGLLL